MSLTAEELHYSRIRISNQKSTDNKSTEMPKYKIYCLHQLAPACKAIIVWHSGALVATPIAEETAKGFATEEDREAQ